MSSAGPNIPVDALINTEDGLKYWESIDPDVDGMLGGIPSHDGFSQISRIDLQSSRAFLAKLGIGVKHGRKKVAQALEGGAGIGRITQGLLLHVADEVDIVEPVAKFTAALSGQPGIRHIHNVGLQDWHPTPGLRYDLIWTQWCVGHLTDDQLVQYLKRCKDALNPNDGVLVLKENVSTSGSDDFDKEDSSVTREDGKFQALFTQAGLRLVRMQNQTGFPTSSSLTLLPVKLYALR